MTSKVLISWSTIVVDSNAVSCSLHEILQPLIEAVNSNLRMDISKYFISIFTQYSL